MNTKKKNGKRNNTLAQLMAMSYEELHNFKRKKGASNIPRSPAQQAQQARMAFVSRFSKPMADLFEYTFRQYAVRMTGRNAANSYLLKHAVTGTTPHFEMDYPKVLISRGDLLGVEHCSATPIGTGLIGFSWVNNAGKENAQPTDRALGFIYCPELQACLYNTTAAQRSEVVLCLDASAFKGKVVHTYLAFVSYFGEVVSDSVYTGECVVE